MSGGQVTAKKETPAEAGAREKISISPVTLILSRGAGKAVPLTQCPIKEADIGECSPSEFVMGAHT